MEGDDGLRELVLNSELQDIYIMGDCTGGIARACEDEADDECGEEESVR